MRRPFKEPPILGAKATAVIVDDLGGPLGHLLPGEKVDFRVGMTAAEFAGSGPKRKPGIRPVSRREAERFATQVVNMVRTKDWRGVSAGHLVALYEHCHSEVYRVPPSELEDGKERAKATIGAARFANVEFKGDLLEVVRFSQWAWSRESYRERKRVETGSSGARLGWRLFFSRSLATDYRIDQARNGKGAR